MSDAVADIEQLAPPAPAVNPLAAARLAAGLSVAEVGRQLKLSGWQIEALEAADYARLPGPVFVRGFVRNYARLLKIDPAPLLAEIAGQMAVVAPEVPVAAAAPSADIPFPGQRSFNWHPYAIGGLLVVAALVGYELYGDDAAEPESETRTVELPEPKAIAKVKPEAAPAAPVEVQAVPTPAPAATSTQTPTLPAPVTAGPMAASPVSATPPAVKASADTRPVQAVKATVEPVPAQAAKPPSDPRPAQIVKTPVDPRPPRSESGGEERVIRMVFSRESWVEVRDRQGHSLLQLNPAGTAQTISAQPPLRLIVGNATGVRMLYNDRPVDLAPHTQVDVARLTLE